MSDSLRRSMERAAYRVILLNFAQWLLQGEFGDGREEQLVDQWLNINGFDRD